MPKLLIISNRYPAHADDGASPFVADFVRGLQRNDVECTVLTPYHYAEKYNEICRTIRFEWGEKDRTIGSLPKLSPISWHKIYKYFKNGMAIASELHEKNRFDLCLALWAAPSGIFARELKKKYNLPYAVWCLGSDIHTYPKIPIVRNQIIQTLKSADKIYSDGYQLGEMAEKLSGRQVDFLPSMRKVEYREYDARIENLFVCPGRVEESKGVFDLLEAFRRISNNNKSWSLYFIGDGSVLNPLKQRIKNYNLSQQVKCLGFVPRDKMYRVVSSSRAIVIPTHSDSLPLTFGEAMQLKKSVIVTDVGDLKVFTEKFDVGQVVPPNSPAKLADAMQNTISSTTTDNPKYKECLMELDIDKAADRFTGWMCEYIGGKQRQKEPAGC